MNTDLIKWWRNVDTMCRSASWASVRARVRARLPRIVRVLAPHRRLARIVLSMPVAWTIARTAGNFHRGTGGLLSHFATDNNLAALRRLEALSPQGALGLDGSGARAVSWPRRVSVALSVIYVCASRRFVGQSRRDLVDQSMFFLFVAAYLIGREIIRTTDARAVVVANDHSSIPCGIVAAAAARGLATGYVQHAQVSQSFPPLKFDVSFLLGERSSSIYRGKGPVRTIVLIGSGRTGQAAVEDGIRAKLARLDCIGVALTNIAPTASVRALLTWLKTDLGAGRVFVRPHPAYKENLADEIGGDIEISSGSLASDARSADLMICGNSSVSLEFLLLGTPVAYSDDLDSVPYDYYGFVAGGILPQIEPAGTTAQRMLEDHYAKDWLEKAAYFDVSFDHSERELQKAADDGFRALLGR